MSHIGSRFLVGPALAFALAVSAAAPCVAQPVNPEEAAASPMADLKKSVEAMSKDIASIRSSMGDLEALRKEMKGLVGDSMDAKQALTNLRGEVDALRKQVADLRAEVPDRTRTDRPRVEAGYSPMPSGPPSGSPATGGADADTCKKNIEQLQKQVAEMNEQLKLLRAEVKSGARSSTREAFYPTGPKGRIVLHNTFNRDMTVLLNGVSYRLWPGESRSVEVPPGPFIYQVLGLHENARTRSVSANETFRIRIYDVESNGGFIVMP